MKGAGRQGQGEKGSRRKLSQQLYSQQAKGKVWNLPRSSCLRLPQVPLNLGRESPVPRGGRGETATQA